MGWRDDPVIADTSQSGKPAWADDPIEGPAKGSGHYLNAMAGVNSAIADTVGAPVDAINWALHHDPLAMAVNAGSHALGYGDVFRGEAVREAAQPRKPIGGSESIKSAMGFIGANPDDFPAVTSTEKLARAAGYGAAMVAAPEFALPKGASLGQRLVRSGKGSLFGGASAVGSEIAADVVPEPWKPTARIVGGLVGGIPAAALTELPRGVAAAGGVLARSVGPVTSKGAERYAGKRLADSATDANAARESLRDVPEYVPGSQPTTFQATGDMGLGSLERETQTKFPAEFQQRRADQNAARLGQMERLQPGGDPADLANFVRAQSRWLDQEYESDIADATRTAQQRLEGLGGALPPDQYGASLRGAVQSVKDAAKARERQLWAAVDPDGDLTVNVSPLRFSARQIVNSVSRSAKPISGDEAGIFDVVLRYRDAVPFRDFTDLRSRVSDAMRNELRTNGETQTYGRLSRLRGSIEDVINSAVERRAQEQPDRLFDELSGFEQEASQWSTPSGSRQKGFGTYDATGPGSVSANRGTQGSRGGQFGSAPGNSRVSPPLGSRAPRPSSLFQAIIQHGGIRVRDAQGNVTPEGGDIANLLQGQNRPGLINNRSGLPPDEIRKRLQDEGWFGRSERFGPTALETGSHPGDSLQELQDAIDREARGEKVFHPEATPAQRRYDPAEHENALEARAAVAGVRRQPGWSLTDWNDAISEREAFMEENARPATLDVEAADRLRAATQATRERAATFKNGSVGQMLASAGQKGQYRTADSSVPAKIFRPGPGGFESVQAFRRAAGDDQALLTLQDYAASELRRFAGKLDGTLDPGKVQTWTQRHVDALRAFPDLEQRFRTAANASDVIADAMTARRVAMDAYQTGVFAKVIGVSDPDDVTRVIGGILNSQSRVEQMRQLALTARRNSNAYAGLRKGVADYIVNRFVSNTEAATSGQGTIKADAFQSFIRQNEAALRPVFNADEFKSLKAIAADLQRANRSFSAVKIPGQSNTAQDLAQLAKGEPSILRRILLQAAGAVGGLLTINSPVVGWLGARTIGAFRDAGMKRVDDILREAMLNPELARALLDKAPKSPGMGSASRLAVVLRKASLVSAAVGVTTGSAQTPAPQKPQLVVSGPEVQNALAPVTRANALMGNQQGQNALARGGYR